MDSIEIAKRVISKEVLRLAFMEIIKKDNLKDIHGNFGKISEWKVNKEHIIKYIKNNEDDIKNLINDICVNKIQNDVFVYIIDDLINYIDLKCKDNELDDALSLYLANKGILPLYGFPSTIRSLFINMHNSKKCNLEEFRNGDYSIERNHIQALSYYSPGTETVKDKAV